MADTFPQTHTTGTRPAVVTTTKNIHVDVNMLKTTSGILKIVEIVLSVITFICCVSGCNPHPHTGWGAFVSFTAILLAVGFLVALLFNVQDMLPQFPLQLFELIVYAVWTVFYLIAGSVLAAISDYARYYNTWYSTQTCHSAAAAGAFFAYICMLVFGFDTVLKFKIWRKTRANMPARNVAAGHVNTGSPQSGPAGTVITQTI